MEHHPYLFLALLLSVCLWTTSLFVSGVFRGAFILLYISHYIRHSLLPMWMFVNCFLEEKSEKSSNSHFGTCFWEAGGQGMPFSFPSKNNSFKLLPIFRDPSHRKRKEDVGSCGGSWNFRKLCVARQGAQHFPKAESYCSIYELGTFSMDTQDLPLLLSFKNIHFSVPHGRTQPSHSLHVFCFALWPGLLHSAHKPLNRQLSPQQTNPAYSNRSTCAQMDIQRFITRLILDTFF